MSSGRLAGGGRIEDGTVGRQLKSDAASYASGDGRETKSVSRAFSRNHTDLSLPTNKKATPQRAGAGYSGGCGVANRSDGEVEASRTLRMELYCVIAADRLGWQVAHEAYGR